MVARALTFGSVAAAYERYRLGYPDELVDDVLTYAGRPVRRALEVGAGTGKATRVFARRDIAVTATDPDAAMLAELRKHVPSSVTTVQAAFEGLALDTSYDLVYAAAALHWTDPVGRWPRVAALLVGDGIFANFGGHVQLVDPAVEAAVVDARAPFLDDASFQPPNQTPADGQPPADMQPPADSAWQWPATELAQSHLFTDVLQTVIPRRQTLSAGDYVGHLSTVSAYLELPVAVRTEVLDRIGRVLPEQVEVTADLYVHLARRTV